MFLQVQIKKLPGLLPDFHGPGPGRLGAGRQRQLGAAAGDDHGDGLPPVPGRGAAVPTGARFGPVFGVEHVGKMRDLSLNPKKLGIFVFFFP